MTDWSEEEDYSNGSSEDLTEEALGLQEKIDAEEKQLYLEFPNLKYGRNLMLASLPLLLQSFLHATMFVIGSEIGIIMTVGTFTFAIVFLMVLLTSKHLTCVSMNKKDDSVRVVDYMAFGRKCKYPTRKISQMMQVDEHSLPGRRSALRHSNILIYFENQYMPLRLPIDAAEAEECIEQINDFIGNN